MKARLIAAILISSILVLMCYNIFYRRFGHPLPAGGMVIVYNVGKNVFETVPRITKTDAEWKKILTPEQYYITVREGTEKPFTNKYYNNKKKGIYCCVRCGTDLFSSDQKYNSGSGWPSFTAPVSEKNVVLFKHLRYFRIPTQVFCARCSAYLGEVFEDGPPPTHKRYCVDSPAFDFVEKKESAT